MLIQMSIAGVANLIFFMDRRRHFEVRGLLCGLVLG